MKGLGSLLPRFALNRPVTVSMFLVAILVMGVLSWQRIPVQLMPSGYDFPYLWVWMPYRDSTPQETERQIVRPVEDAIETLPGVRRLKSGAGRNFARFEIELDQNVDMDEAWSALTERLERARLELPDDFDKYYVYKYNPSDSPIIWAAVTFPSEEHDPAFLVDRRIKRDLERVPGVARVEFHGAHRSRVYIDFNREALDRHGISLYDTMQRIRASNFTMPSGSVDENGQVVLLRSIATFESDQQIAALPIGKGRVLGDVAEVMLARPMSTSIHRVNGKNAGSIDIYKESGANTLEVSRRVHDALATLHADPDLEGYEVLPFFDQGKLIQESVDNLLVAAVQGGILAVFVLLLFLRRLRVTLLIAAAIPLSLLMTIVIQYGLGESINLLSMMGMMLSVGMTVDNSVVVVESIYRHRELGSSAAEAAVDGTKEVALAILAATLTTIVVFLPIILMSDDAGFSFFMGRLGLPVCFALGSSLLVALVLVPLATLLTNEPAKPSPWLNALVERYETLLRWVLSHRSTAFAVTMLVLGSMAYPMNNLDKSDTEQDGLIDFVVGFKFPSTFSTAEIDRTLTRYEKLFEAKRQKWRIRALRVRRWDSSDRAFLMAFMEKRQRGDISKEDIEEQLPELIESLDSPGVQSWVGWRPQGDDDKSLDIKLYGEDADRLVELGEEIVRRLSAVPGILGAKAEFEDSEMELHVDINRERAARYGVAADVLASTVSFAFRGSQLPPAQIDGREVAVQAGYRLQDRSDIRTLQDFGIWSPLGGEVALGTVANLSFAKGRDYIRRENRKTGLNLSVTVEEDDLSSGYELIRQGLTGLKLPRGYSWSAGDRWAEFQKQDRARKFALMMSVAFVFLLMGMLFESVWTPLAVLFSIPFAFVGVYWMLFVTATTFEVMAGIGLVILVGIVVNNAIVLLDRVQQYRHQGMVRERALLLAGRERLRPILMTAATTIVGLLPMAIGKSGIVGTPYYPLGRAVIGGLVVSTALSLLLVPLFYTYLDDLRHSLAAAVRASPSAPLQTPDLEEA